MESRNGTCRIQVHLQKVPQEDEALNIYGFVRESGWLLGIFLGIWKLMEVLAGAFFILSLTSVFFLARKKMSRKQSIPFFPFLAIGYLLQVLAGGMKG